VPGATAKDDFAANLESLSAQHRVVFIDLPSFGGSVSATTNDPRSAGTLIADLLAHLQVDKASVIGNGLGGEIALNLAADSPQAVDRLVLIAPAGCRFSPFTPVPMEGLKAVASYWQQPSPAAMAGVLALLRVGPAPAGAAEAETRHDDAISAGLKPGFAEAYERDPLSIAPQIEAPTLLLWGREDRFSPLDYGLNLLARIPNARFHLLPRAGHNAQKDASDEVNALLRDFLGGNP
jgi:pimeloyl-ACP methyl ester carboxylesterase